MPNTCRAATFMSGKPAGSSILVMAAVVINPPRSRALPETEICDMAADGGLPEPIRERGLAEARGPIKVPLRYHQDRYGPRFLEGCPANHAVLSRAQFEHPVGCPGGRHFPPAGVPNPESATTSCNIRCREVRTSAPAASYVRSPEPDRQPRNFVTSFIDQLIAFVSANAWLAYLTLFLAALLEAVPVVGSVIPGSTVILALSALIPGGELKLEWVLAAAIAGALLGDGSAFWIGHRAQSEILSAWPLSNFPRVIAHSEAFFRRWGMLAVFFARFVPP